MPAAHPSPQPRAAAASSQKELAADKAEDKKLIHRVVHLRKELAGACRELERRQASPRGSSSGPQRRAPSVPRISTGSASGPSTPRQVPGVPSPSSCSVATLRTGASREDTAPTGASVATNAGSISASSCARVQPITPRSTASAGGQSAAWMPLSSRSTAASTVGASATARSGGGGGGGPGSSSSASTFKSGSSGAGVGGNVAANDPEGRCPLGASVVSPAASQQHKWLVEVTPLSGPAVAAGSAGAAAVVSAVHQQLSGRARPDRIASRGRSSCGGSSPSGSPVVARQRGAVVPKLQLSPKVAPVCIDRDPASGTSSMDATGVARPARAESAGVVTEASPSRARGSKEEVRDLLWKLEVERLRCATLNLEVQRQIEKSSGLWRQLNESAPAAEAGVPVTRSPWFSNSGGASSGVVAMVPATVGGPVVTRVVTTPLRGASPPGATPQGTPRGLAPPMPVSPAATVTVHSAAGALVSPRIQGPIVQHPHKPPESWHLASAPGPLSARRDPSPAARSRANSSSSQVTVSAGAHVLPTSPTPGVALPSTQAQPPVPNDVIGCRGRAFASRRMRISI